VISRIASQISTGTPGKPILRLRIGTRDCRTLERVLHGILKFQGRQALGGGAEWFVVQPTEIAEIFTHIEPLLSTGASEGAGR
jgi:hypothetical protein